MEEIAINFRQIVMASQRYKGRNETFSEMVLQEGK